MKLWQAPFLVPLKLLMSSELWEEAQKIIRAELAEEASQGEVSLFCPNCNHPVTTFGVQAKLVQNVRKVKIK